MADHSKPLLTSTYTNFLAELDGRLDDLALGLNPSYVTATNVPTNSVRWNGGSSKWEKYNGSSWADLAATYAISISGNAGTVTNGVVTSGSYSNPSWLTSLAGSKISGDIAGNAGTATRLATARAINGVNFDGTAGISINLNNSLTFNNGGSGAGSGATFNGSGGATISYNTIGAPSTTGANASGTWGINISGNAATATTATTCSRVEATATGTNSAEILRGNMADNDQFRILVGGTATNSGYVELATADDGTEPIYVRQYTGVFASVTRTLTLLDGSGNTTVPGSFTASGNVTAYSDETLKRDWAAIGSDFVARLAQTRAGTYTRIDSGERQAGSSAQDWQRLLPEVVSSTADGTLSLAYGNAALVSAIELAKAVVTLQARVAHLEAKLIGE